MSNGDNNLYEFGGFRFDAESRTLWRGDEMVSLPPKALEVLFMLIGSNGKLVSKQEILKTVWAATFVEEGVLTQNIFKLRTALGKDSDGKQFIENIARRGYRLTVPVKILTTDEVAVLNSAKINNNFAAAVASDFPTESFTENAFNGSPSVDEKNESEYVLKSSPEVSSTKRKSRSIVRAVFFAGLGILIFTAIGFGIYKYFSSRSEKAESKIAPIEQLRIQRLTDTGDIVFPTISPNGELLAFVRLEDEKGSVWVKQIATDSQMQILPSSERGYSSLVFSPDGKYIFFRQEADGGAIYQTTVLGGAPKKAAENVWSDFNISPDGKQFVFVRRDVAQNRYLLILSNVDGSGERELAAKNAPEDFRNSAAFSPDGTKIVIASGLRSQFFPKILTIDTATGAETELEIPRWRVIQKILWMPKGDQLIITAREAKEATSQMWMLSYPSGKVRRLTNDLEAYFWISLSADGQKLVTRQQRIFSHLWILPEGDLKKARQITSGVRNQDGYGGLAWTPNGKIIFTAFANNSTNLFSIDADGANRVQLTNDAGQENTSPSVSRDGRFIAFVSNRSGAAQIWRMDVDGGGNQKQITFGDKPNERAQSPAFSADGAEIFFIKRGENPPSIWKVSIEGGETAQISNLRGGTSDGFIAVSPDSRRIAFQYIADRTETGRENQTFGIGILPTDATGEPQIFELPMRRPFVQWTSDTAFDFAAGAFNTSSLMRQSINGGEPQKLIDFPDRVFNFAWSPDGKNLAAVRGKQMGDAILITNLP